MYVNSITFILIWVPFGLGSSFYKNTTLQQRYDSFVQEKVDTLEVDHDNTVFFYFLAISFFIYVLVLPVVIYLTDAGKLRNNGNKSSEMGEKHGGGNTRAGDTTVPLSSPSPVGSEIELKVKKSAARLSISEDEGVGQEDEVVMTISANIP